MQTGPPRPNVRSSFWQESQAGLASQLVLLKGDSTSVITEDKGPKGGQRTEGLSMELLAGSSSGIRLACFHPIVILSSLHKDLNLPKQLSPPTPHASLA